MPSSVLIVDDEPGLRELLRRWLSSSENLVFETPSAEDAMHVLAQTPDIAVALVDLQMPGRGGAWLVEQMRQSFPSVAIILATADAQVPGSISLQPTVIGYLVKPLDRETVLTLVADGHAWHQRQMAAPETQAGDPIDAFLDSKLNRGLGRGGTQRN